MSSFARAGIAVLVVLALHALATGLYWYQDLPWFDIPMHFSGGVAVALLTLAIWDLCIEKVNFQKSVGAFWRQVILAVLVLGVVALVGIAWEWYEFAFDQIALVAYPNLPPAQTSLSDTMADLALDLLGGLVALISVRGFARRKDL
jgi:hypothetical protein